MSGFNPVFNPNQVSSGSSLFGGTQKLSFGAPAASTAAAPLSFGSLTTTKSATPSLFGAAATTALTGFSFGAKPAASTSSLFGTTTSTAAGGLFGGGLKLDGATTTASTGFSFGALGSSTAPAAASTAISTAAPAKPLENPKEEKVPPELNTLITDLEKFITTQMATKESITKISSEEIDKCKEEIKSLNQVLSLAANAIQRDVTVVANLKVEVSQELRNAQVVHRANEMLKGGASFYASQDFTEPIEYFQRLVYSFENRINCYRQEIDELEIFLSSTSPLHEFSPQDLSNVLKCMNDSFLGVAAHLQTIHESVKSLKQQYLQYQHIVHNDDSDPFSTNKKKSGLSGSQNLAGPSPFPPMQGRQISQPSFQSLSTGSTTQNTGFGTSSNVSSLFKPAASQGLFRSLSAGGGTNKLGGGSLFGATTPGPKSSSQVSSFTLGNPPKGKSRRF